MVNIKFWRYGMIEYTVEQIKEMGLYERVSCCRLFMQEEGIKKLVRRSQIDRYSKVLKY